MNFFKLFCVKNHRQYACLLKNEQNLRVLLLKRTFSLIGTHVKAQFTQLMNCCFILASEMAAPTSIGLRQWTTVWKRVWEKSGNELTIRVDDWGHVNIAQSAETENRQILLAKRHEQIICHSGTYNCLKMSKSVSHFISETLVATARADIQYRNMDVRAHFHDSLSFRILHVWKRS